MPDKHLSIDMSQCGFVDPQLQLGAALAHRDLKSFRAALEMGAEPLQADANHMSVFERALHTYGCAEFVRECLKHGCNPNHVNKHHKKGAINFAADSLDPQIVAELLAAHPSVQVDRVCEKLTPLNALAKSLNADNAAEVANCMKQLLHYGASANIPDQREFTPLLYVLKNRKIDETKKRELIQMFLDQPDIDLDTYRNGELRLILQDQYAGQWKLPPLREPSGSINVDTLRRHLRSGDEEQFRRDFEEYVANRSQCDNLTNSGAAEHVSLLVECIKRGAHEAFDQVLKSVQNVNLKHDSKKPIEVAAIWGNWYALQQLLRHDQIEVHSHDELLTHVVRRLDEKPVFEHCDHQRCFELLLASEHVDVNECDRSGSTPLHYAVKYRNTEAVKTLLRHGAYLGKRSAFNDLPVSEMLPAVLEEHFDECVTTNGLKPGDEHFEIAMNYMNLIPLPKKSSLSSTETVQPQQLRDEMTPIAFLADSKEHRHLLQHPLITSYLFLKWHRLSVVFYMNFLCYALFAVSIIVHTLLKFRESDHQTWTTIFGLLAWIGIVYMIVRELLQFIVSPSMYFRSPMNYMEFALIALSIVTCSEPSYDRETQRVVAVFTILLVALELCLLVGSLPVLSISTHMLMLREVSRSFLKSFTLYSIFVITFSLCFYILFGKPELDETGLPKPDEDGEFNKFSNPVAALIKTIVMLTGEFDAGDINFDGLYSYLIFLLFVVFMAIVLFNLLNGLAVSDTQVIKAQAELNGSICRANLLVRYEEVLTGRSDRTNFIVNHEPFRTICRRLINVYPNYIAGRQIAILPNDGNKVMIPMANAYEMRDLVGGQKSNFLPIATNDNERAKKPLDPPIHCLCSCISGKCSRMDTRTVKMALAVLDQKVTNKLEKHRQLNTEKRLQNIEEKLQKIFALLEKQTQ